jgi:hypothetical protein
VLIPLQPLLDFIPNNLLSSDTCDNFDKGTLDRTVLLKWSNFRYKQALDEIVRNMATTLLPPTPYSEAAMPPPPVRRSSTLPTVLNENASSRTQKADDDEILFSSHSAVRIFKFTPRRVALQRTSVRDTSTEAEAGTLPWASRPEETEGYGGLLPAGSLEFQY